MRITALELAASWGEPARRIAEVDARLAAGAPTDLVLLPELALHGYVSPDGDFDVAPFAEPIDGPTARGCAELARRHAVHLVAPLPLREGRAIYNAMACFDPRGDVAFVYRKRHPWLPETWANRGPRVAPTLEIAGRVLTIAICYDVHFLGPRELVGSDVLLFPSAWVEEVDTRIPQLAGLAREYGIHIINANWAPGVVRIAGQGDSCIVGPAGDVLARAELGGRIDIELPSAIR